MKLIFLLTIAASLAQAPPPKVDGPKGVDVNVTNISWHPQGIGLLYTKQEGTGTGIGIYALGQPEGEVVVHMGKNDSYEAQWFDNQTMVTIIVYRELTREGEPYGEATVYLADAVKGQAQALWSQAYTEESGGIDLDVDVSPRLRHAIYRVKNGQNRYHMVLPVSGGRLIASADLDRAQKEGLAGPSWSLDGTAVYARPSESQASSEVGELRSDEILISRVAAKVEGELKLSNVSFRFNVAKPPPPPVGATVLELMPSNAALRQVRFKGPWQHREMSQDDVRTFSRATNIQFGGAAFTANSLWLVRGKQPTDGLLLAAHAEKSWIAPGSAAVAYLTDGALFVRELGK